eukprot:3641279-Pyramimonas_sp.AAC.1
MARHLAERARAAYLPRGRCQGPELPATLAEMTNAWTERETSLGARGRYARRLWRRVSLEQYFA